MIIAMDEPETLTQEPAATQPSPLAAMRRAVAVMSHELRNPLGVVRAGLDLLPEHCHEIESLKPMLLSHVEQMIRLVDDLGEMSRNGHGKVSVDKKSVELCPVIEEIVRAMNSMYQSRNQTLSVEMVQQAVRLHADRVRISQVIQNLLSNASKYGNPGGETILKVGVDGDWAILEVSDNGIGIDSALLPVIFDYFTQADGADALDHRDRGLGIGLGLVQDIVRAHGGTVHATSDGKGCGSDFVVRLPLCEAHDGDVEEPDEIRSLQIYRV